MGTAIATAVRTAGLVPNRSDTDIQAAGTARAAFGRSRAWKRFLKDFSTAMVMTDPIAFGWSLVWTHEAEARP